MLGLLLNQRHDVRRCSYGENPGKRQDPPSTSRDGDHLFLTVRTVFVEDMHVSRHAEEW